MKYINLIIYMILNNVYCAFAFGLFCVLSFFVLVHILYVNFGPTYEDFCHMSGFSPDDVEVKKK